MYFLNSPDMGTKARASDKFQGHTASVKHKHYTYSNS